MPRRCSKLQHRLQEIFAPNIRLQFHCAIYRIPGHVDTVCPRYFLMLNSEIIWDWLDFSHYFRWLFANFRECSLIS